MKVLPKLGGTAAGPRWRHAMTSGSCEVFFFPRLVDRMHQKIGNSIELMNRNGTHAHTDVATHRAEGPTSRCFDSLHKAS